MNKKWITNNFDIIYITLTFVFLLLDFLTKNEVIEAIGFIFITIGFVYTVFHYINKTHDERVKYLKLYSGYITFMISIIIISISQFLLAYTDLVLNTSDLLRYITLFLYLIFTITYAIVKRRM